MRNCPSIPFWYRCATRRRWCRSSLPPCGLSTTRDYVSNAPSGWPTMRAVILALLMLCSGVLCAAWAQYDGEGAVGLVEKFHELVSLTHPENAVVESFSVFSPAIAIE